MTELEKMDAIAAGELYVGQRVIWKAQPGSQSNAGEGTVADVQEHTVRVRWDEDVGSAKQASAHSKRHIFPA